MKEFIKKITMNYLFLSGVLADIPHLFQRSNYFHLRSSQSNPQIHQVLPVKLFLLNVRIAKPAITTARYTPN